MEPHFQNPHLDYQISVFSLPPEVTVISDFDDMQGAETLIILDSVCGGLSAGRGTMMQPLPRYYIIINSHQNQLNL